MKNLFLIVLLAGFFFSCHQKAHFTITGQVTSRNGEKVYLAKLMNDKLKVIDSTLVKGGKFKFTGNQATPEFYYILNSTKNSDLKFFLENAEIKIIGTLDTLWKAKIAGSPSQKEYSGVYASLDKISSGSRPIWVKLDSARKSNHTELAVIYKKQLDSMKTEYEKFQSDYISSHPTSPVSVELIMDNSYMNNPERLESWINMLDPSLKNSDRVMKISHKVEVMKKVAVGQTAPDFEQNDSTSTKVRLSSHFGKYLLIDFWASWCGPCRGENPNVVTAYERFHKKGFDIISVSLDEDRKKWLGAVKKDNLTWTQVSDLQGWTNEVAKIYGIYAIPDNFLLDKNGTILARGLRDADLTEKLEELLGK